MQLEALKIFCDVVRRASFSRGAKENGISQSSASQVVHQLEVRLGVKLIDRSKRPLVPTPQGQVYFDGCRDLVARYLEVENRVRALSGDRHLAGVVRLAAIYSVGFHHMSRFVEQFRTDYPAVEVALEYGHPKRVTEGVLAGEADLGLVSFPRKRPELVTIPWRSEEMVLAVHPTHRLAGFDAIDPAELDGETFVGFDGGLPIRREIDKFLRKSGVHVRVALEFDNIETIKRAVEVPSGVAILPEPTTAGEVRAGTLRTVRFQGVAPRRPLAVIHRRGDPLPLAATRFLAALTASEPPAKLGVSVAAPATASASASTVALD